MPNMNKIILLVPGIRMAFFLQAQDAGTIVNRSDSFTYAPLDQVNRLRIVLSDSKGRQQEREAIASQLGTDYRLFRFTAPASQDGIAFLSLPDDVMYVYLPAYDKARRIASHVKNQSFAGTDLSYEDMEAVPISSKYDVRILETTDDDYLLEMIPKPDRKSDYSKLHMRINRKNYTVMSSEYFDRGGIKVKTMTNNKIENVNGYWIITDLLMTDLKTNHSTRLIFTDTQVDTGLSPDDFSVRVLTR